MRKQTFGRVLRATLIASCCWSPVAAQMVDVRDVTIVKPFKTKPKAKTSFLSTAAEGIPTEDLKAEVGHGYDPIENRILPDVCVAPVDAPGVLEPSSKSDVYFDKVKTLEQNENASSTSFSFGALIKVVSVGFSHSDTESNYFNRVDGFGRVKVRLATKGVQLGKVKWADKVSPPTNTAGQAAFVGKCGTYFVRAVYSGQMLDDWVRFSLRADQKTRTSGNALSIGVGKVFSGSFGTGDAASNVNCFSDVTFSHHGLGAAMLPPLPGGTTDGAGAGGANSGAGAAGGQKPSAARLAAATNDPTKPKEPEQPGPPTPPTPPKPDLPSKPTACDEVTGKSELQTLIDWYNGGFRQAVLAAPLATAKPLYFLVDRYVDPDVRLPDTKYIPIWVDQLIEAVSASTGDYYTLVSTISELNFVLEEGPVERLAIFYDLPPEMDNSVNPPVVKKTSEAIATERLASAKKMLDAYHKAVMACRKYALGPETVGASTAVKLCQDELNGAITPTALAALRLKRNYADEPSK